MTPDQTPDQRITDRLEPGEQLLWAGRPVQGIRFQAGDILMIPFSLMVGGFVWFWERAVILSGAPLLFRLWGIPFILAAVWLVAGRFVWDARRRSRTAYGITNSRVVILDGGVQRGVRSLELKTLTDVTLSARDDGSGTIVLGPIPSAFAFPARGSTTAAALVPKFERIADARTAYDILRRAQAAAT